MAITIISNIAANSYHPSANPINLTVNSNNTGKCNFRYVCDVYVDGINVFRFKLFPDAVTGRGFFQISDVVGDYLTQNTETSTGGVTLYPASDSINKSICRVQLRFGEEYDNSPDCDGEVKIFPNLAISNQFYVYYGALDYEEWPSYNYLDYTVDFTNKPTKFLTKVPRGSVECAFGDSYYLDLLTNAALVNVRVRVTIYKTTGSPIVLNFIPPAQASSQRRFRIACGPYQINKQSLFIDGSTNTNLIDAYTRYYTVQLRSSTGIPLTELFRINVSKPKERRKRIGFTGSLGGIEYITFYHRDVTSFQIDRKNFKSYLTTRKGNNWTYDVGDRQNTTYAVSAKENHQVTTFVNKEISSWLYEMWLSTDVWVDDRPTQMPFKVYKNQNAFEAVISNPSSNVQYMVFYLPENHGLKVGDSFYTISDDKPEYIDYNSRFTVISVFGRVVNVGITYNNYNLTESACGWLVKDEPLRKIPIVVNDDSVEVKQKLDRPIEYSLSYSKSVDKITLRS